MKRESIETFISAVLAFAAIGVGAALVHREFLVHSPGPGAAPIVQSIDGMASASTYVRNWTDIFEHGIVVGPAEAKVRIIEFADIECPFCARFDEITRRVRAKFPHDVSVTFVHFPLPMHRFARPAARVAECAARFGNFDHMLQTLYGKHDSLGLKTWSSYALEAGVSDTSSFARCASDTAVVPRIEAGVALAKRLELHGTPTVLVNGWRFRVAPDEHELSRVVAAIAAGKQPFDTARRQPQE